MKIALTGSSSTGKTTLANTLMQIREFRQHVDEFLTTDARALLRNLGFQSMDVMKGGELRRFQRLYFERKTELERNRTRFLTDRSFVDVAAYWVQRDTIDSSEALQELIGPCRQAAQKYDLHVYLPFGLVSFQPDGYRSMNLALHRAIDVQILEFLRAWNLHVVILDTAEHAARVSRVLSAVRGLLDGAGSDMWRPT